MKPLEDPLLVFLTSLYIVTWMFVCVFLGVLASFAVRCRLAYFDISQLLSATLRAHRAVLLPK